MYNYKCLQKLLEDNTFDIRHLIEYYISYVSVFYCIDIDEHDDKLDTLINDLQDYVYKKVKEN